MPGWSTQETVLARAPPAWAPLHPTSPSCCLSPYPPTFVSPTTITSPLLRALKQSVKGPCSPFLDLFKSRVENYPHSPTPMGHGSGPSSNPRPLHSQPPSQETGAGMTAGGCLWSSAGLQTHGDKGERTGKRAVSAHVSQSVRKPCLCVYPHAYTHMDTHSKA